MTSTDPIATAMSLLLRSEYAVAVTGAGVSTPSGIPDFRSPESGLWEQVDPMKVATLAAFRRRPEVFYQWIRPLVEQVTEAIPNPAHVALVKMEQLGILQAIISQNIDGLHRQAGSKRVIEIHGHFRTATCLNCYRTTSGQVVLDQLMGQAVVPVCRECGGTLKPDVILFGEQIPFAALQSAYCEIQRCDLVLVAGSSLTVEPAASLPILAKERGARFVLINLQETPLDDLADAVIHGDVASVLPALAGALSESNLTVRRES
jgi:NAD-dependent deacetylase